MKVFCLHTMIGILLLISTNWIQAQPTQTQLHTTELMKHFSGTWKAVVAKDIFYVVEEESFPSGKHGINMVANSAIGETVNEKTELNTYQGLQDFDNLHHPKILNTLKGYQLKSAMADVQKYDSTIYEVWDTITNQWVGDIKDVFIYDADGKITIWIGYNWNDSISQWVVSGKSESTYDSNGNCTLGIRYNWDKTTSQWIASDKNEYTYDEYGNCTLGIRYNWDKTTSQWIGIYKVTYYYSEPNFIPKIPETTIYVYPNPAKEYVVFDLTNISSSATVELFDLQGKKVLEQKLSENKQISIGNLPKGLYMYKLNNRGIIYKGKLIIE